MSLLKYKLAKLFSSTNILCISNSKLDDHDVETFNFNNSPRISVTKPLNRQKFLSKSFKGFRNRAHSNCQTNFFEQQNEASMNRICKSAENLYIVNTGELNLNELKLFTINQLNGKNFESIKLKEIFPKLPSHYTHNTCEWMDNMSILDIKSVLWMDEFELYPLKINKIKSILSELYPTAETSISETKQSPKKPNNFLTIPCTTEVKNKKFCLCCFQSTVDCLFFDCGHMISCNNCSKHFRNCTLCGQKIIQAIKVQN